MADNLEASPQGLFKVAANLGDISSRMKQTMTNLQNDISQYGSTPWGDDSTGNQFAQGDSGYIAQSSNVFDAVNSMTKLLTEYQDAINKSGKTLQDQEG